MTIVIAAPNIVGMNKSAIQVIDALGGTAKVAKLFDVRMPSVCGWKRHGIPAARMQLIKAVHHHAIAGIDIHAATAKRSSKQQEA